MVANPLMIVIHIWSCMSWFRRKLMSRERSNILLLPPYQHKEYECFLLEVLNDVAISENVIDFTVELSLDNFQHVYSCIDTLRLLHFEPIKHLGTMVVSLLKKGKLSHSR